MNSAAVAMRASVSPSPSPSPSPSSYFTKPRKPFFPASSKPFSSFTFFKSLALTHSPNLSSSSFVCSAATSSPSRSSDLATGNLERLIAEFKSLSEPVDRVKRLLRYATLLPPLDEGRRIDANRVMGCTAQVWLDAAMDGDGRMRFAADSDSEITRGFCSCLVRILDGAVPEEVLSLKTEDLADLNVAGFQGRSNSRVNTWHNVLIGMQKRTKAIVAAREGKPPGEPFPSLVISAGGIQAKGSYAEAQVSNLWPYPLH